MQYGNLLRREMRQFPYDIKYSMVVNGGESRRDGDCGER